MYLRLKLSILLSTIILFTYSCGFSPIYSSSNKINFNIETIEITGDNDLTKFLRENLKKYNNETSIKKIKIEGKLIYEKISKTKDLAGNTTQYELQANSNFIITAGASSLNFKVLEKFDMKNIKDEFEESDYERAIKENFARSISNKIIMQISRLK